MEELFIRYNNGQLFILNNGSSIFPFVEIFIDGQYLGAFALDSELRIPLMKRRDVEKITFKGYERNKNGTVPYHQTFQIHNRKKVSDLGPSPNYKPGDVLVACDNVNGLPYGYMGHSAIVVDDQHIIEAVVTEPIVRKVPISQLTQYHKIHAHFRPKNAELGKKAASYAEKYLETFNKIRKSGLKHPYFYFSLNFPLNDEWTYIYCSKLVWLSYHYGAGYTMPNDHLWFSPEDLYTIMSNSNDFELIYKHPNYQFIINL